MEGTAKWLATGFEPLGCITAGGSTPLPSLFVQEQSDQIFNERSEYKNGSARSGAIGYKQQCRLLTASYPSQKKPTAYRHELFVTFVIFGLVLNLLKPGATPFMEFYVIRSSAMIHTVTNWH